MISSELASGPCALVRAMHILQPPLLNRPAKKQTCNQHHHDDPARDRLGCNVRFHPAGHP